MNRSLDTFCKALAQSHLLTPGELHEAHSRWRRAREGGEDPERLPAWLVAHHYLTRYQARRLLEGDATHFFLGRYKLLARLGHGTMARVYKAICPDGHLFAVKVLPPSRARDPRWLRLFEREAHDATRYLHPHVVRTYERGEADGVRYIAMEYLDGETLDDVLRRRGRLPYVEAARLVYQALQGLQHIHDRGAVHGNLEPTHLMLLPVPALGQPDTTLDATVKLLDAGLGSPVFGTQVEVVREQVRDCGEAPLDGQVDYLAPELARHQKGADIRADVYALGCVLYHCLAGQPPFPGGTVLERLLRRSTQGPVPVGQLNAEVPQGLQVVVERMMAWAPGQRYPDPAAAAEALLPFLPAPRSTAPVPVAFPVGLPAH